MPKIKCLKCGQEAERLSQPPYPGALGALILDNTCQKCLDEWKKFSVMVINDYKLRPFLPDHRAILEKNLKQFLNLEPQEIQAPQPLEDQTSSKPQSGGEGEEATRAHVIAMLEQIFDPEIPINIYDLGLIYDIGLIGNTVTIRMTLTTPHCPAAKSLPASVKEALERIPGVKEARIEMVWDPPWTRDKISPEGKSALGLT